MASLCSYVYCHCSFFVSCVDTILLNCLSIIILKIMIPMIRLHAISNESLWKIAKIQNSIKLNRHTLTILANTSNYRQWDTLKNLNGTYQKAIKYSSKIFTFKNSFFNWTWPNLLNQFFKNTLHCHLIIPTPPWIFWIWTTKTFWNRRYFQICYVFCSRVLKKTA